MRVGTLGGGQLAQMLAQAAKPLDIELVALVGDTDCPAQHDAELVQGDQSNPADVQAFVKNLDVLTFEFENVDFETLEQLSLPIHPNLNSLKTAQDRELEKNFFVSVEVPTTDFVIASSAYELALGIETIGLPCVIKTCRDGYDGKGQYVLREPIDADSLWHQLGGKRLIVENCVNFDREVSMIAARGQDGNIVYYPLTENRHEDGILRVSKVVLEQDSVLKKAKHYIRNILENLDYIGILAVEFFQVGDGLIANEMAPRVHNSGHWTIEGCKTSQFENHIRAVCGLPLGSAEALGPCAMINFIAEMPAPEQLATIQNAELHDYHKSARPGRKLAHLTLGAPTQAELDDNIQAVLNLIS